MSATNTNATSVAAEARERLRRRDRTREKERTLRALDKNWRAFLDSTYGIPESLMSEGGVRGNWSVKDHPRPRRGVGS